MVSTLALDPDFVDDLAYVDFNIFRCSTTVFDVVYSSTNGDITIADSQPSDLNMSQSINGPTIFSLLFAASEQANLQSFLQSGFSQAL